MPRLLRQTFCCAWVLLHDCALHVVLDVVAQHAIICACLTTPSLSICFFIFIKVQWIGSASMTQSQALPSMPLSDLSTRRVLTGFKAV